MDFLIFADDLTGAFDIAVNGRAYDRPIKVIWEKEGITSANGDLIFCTENREKNSIQARELLRDVASITKEYCLPKLVYMKVDSMLRGNIIEEIIAVDAVYDFDYIVIDVAYPHLGRTVCEGDVFINGNKLQNTDIVYDINATPTSNAFLNNLNKAFYGKVQCLKYYEKIEDNSKVLFFDTEREEEFIQIIQKVSSHHNARILWVGSIGLYVALLRIYYKPRKVFCVIGSVSDISKKQIMKAQNDTTSLVEVALCNEKVEYYVQRILSLMKTGKNVILYSERIRCQISEKNVNNIKKICKCIYNIAAEVIGREKGINLIVSGGETAMRLLSKKDIININIIGEIEKSVPILEVQEENTNYAVAIKSGRVGDEHALIRHIEFMRKYANVSR